MTAANKPSRRQQILESFAKMLEAKPGARITTAALAKEVGVSEAALYRHFPSKTKMYEGLIEFIEETIFSRVNLIASDDKLSSIERCDKILFLLLTFSERNPGISRILTGDALAGETERLHKRISQFFDRLETQLKQILRDAELREGLHLRLSIADTSQVWLATAEGFILRYVKSHFRHLPSKSWPLYWPSLSEGFIANK